MVATFKIITMSSAVEEKVIDIYNDHFYDSGSVHINGTRIGCWKSGGHGDQTFLQVLENSCNLGINTGTYLNLKKNLQII
ncbi:MAG: hypothetical protein IJ068_05565 [Bacilli bacterium]|nr:hypothetical protein [Bacilli bacterium]